MSEILLDLCINENEAKIKKKDCLMYNHVQVSGAYMDSECYVPSSLKNVWSCWYMMERIQINLCVLMIYGFSAFKQWTTCKKSTYITMMESYSIHVYTKYIQGMLSSLYNTAQLNYSYITNVIYSPYYECIWKGYKFSQERET